MIFQTANSPVRLVMWIFVWAYLIVQYWNLSNLLKILKKRDKTSENKAVVLGITSLLIGDTIHGLYLTAAYFMNDLSLMGLGHYAMMLTSIFMTGYYMGILFFHKREFTEGKSIIHYLIAALGIIRMAICLLPGNNYITTSEEGIPFTRIVSNIVFCIFGAIAISMLYISASKRNEPKDEYFKKSVIWGFISFLFYILHLILYPINPAFGSMMLFKSLAYIGEVYYIVKAFKS